LPTANPADANSIGRSVAWFDTGSARGAEHPKSPLGEGIAAAGATRATWMAKPLASLCVVA
jgi:hypothetical protein